MSFFGVEINAQMNKMLMEIKLQLSKNKFKPNFRTMYRSFAENDPEVTGKINIEQF